ncbi:hypothetical protein BDV25DRAFT_122055 [Aspergillus avenaceus]|uniref:Uncharacterized protein n=1 Tax=Aspergillus avenaceus TaxID=36643 RepID=A0A5N6TUN4_ASPAV|nr:hypothetical protein BDV25DRAFT_122055 [Aspergillus avenaceus]
MKRWKRRLSVMLSRFQELLIWTVFMVYTVSAQDPAIPNRPALGFERHGQENANPKAPTLRRLPTGIPSTHTLIGYLGVTPAHVEEYRATRGFEWYPREHPSDFILGKGLNLYPTVRRNWLDEGLLVCWVCADRNKFDMTHKAFVPDSFSVRTDLPEPYSNNGFIQFSIKEDRDRDGGKENRMAYYLNNYGGGPYQNTREVVRIANHPADESWFHVIPDALLHGNARDLDLRMNCTSERAATEDLEEIDYRDWTLYFSPWAL